jgi:hypothetical protein
MSEQIAAKPVEIKDFSLKDASEILEKQDPRRLPQWQIQGEPLVVGPYDEIRIVMIKIDRVGEPTILVPSPGPMLVR